MTGPSSIACWHQVSDFLTRVRKRALWPSLAVAVATYRAAAAGAERVVIPLEGEVTPDPTILAGFWEPRLWPIIGEVGFCLLQVAWIIGLLVNRAKRRQSEAEATLIADISSKFVNLAADEVDREIMDAERRICELLGLDLAAIWQWSDSPPGGFALTHFYSVKDGPQPSTRLNQEDFPWCREQMLAGRIVAIDSLKDLPAEAAHDRDVCRQLGIKSHLCIPLAVGGGSPVGILSLNTTRAERGWPAALVKRLQLVAQIFANALARKRTEVALREHADKFQTIVSTTADGFWVVDREGRILEANDECCRLYGYRHSELLALSIKDFEVTRDAAETQRHIALISAAGFSRFETRHRCKDGGIVDIEVSATYRAHAATFIAFLRNITRRRHAEQETFELRGLLAHADRVTLLGQLASALAHELSQPLGAILRNVEAAEILLQTAAPDVGELRAIVKDILSDDRRAGQVIERLRSLLQRPAAHRSAKRD